MKLKHRLDTLTGRILHALIRRLTKSEFSSSEYWEKRYAANGNSGAGSYGRLAQFKADALNSIVVACDIETVIEFGCGDGNQLSLATYPRYVGFDVSKTAIGLCKQQFQHDNTKSFFLYEPMCFVDTSEIFRADLSISLDVMFHLVEDSVFTLYTQHLFQSSSRYVIIYAPNLDYIVPNSHHVRYRKFSDWIDSHLSEWELVGKIDNQYPEEYDTGSFPSDFFIYRKAASALIENNKHDSLNHLIESINQGLQI